MADETISEVEVRSEEISQQRREIKWWINIEREWEDKYTTERETSESGEGQYSRDGILECLNTDEGFHSSLQEAQAR
jgi:hypothetical protein